jgi:hypothetical protein
MKKAIVVLMCFVFVLFSCKKEDTVPPIINSVNIQPGDTLRNSFNIKVDASDNSMVSSIEVYANDSLIIKDTKSPLDFNLNTLAMKDGEYTFKTIVYDAKSNKTESSTKVQIQNALVTLNIDKSYPLSYKVLISDEQGNILRSLSFQNGGKIKIMPETACDKKAINLIFDVTSNGYTGITAYIHVKRGSEYNGGSSAIAPIVKGVKLHLKNDIGSFSHIRISTDQTSYILMSMADTINLPNLIPYSTDHKLLLQLETGNGQFYKLLPIANITELTENLSDINQTESLKTFSLPSNGTAELFLQGIGNDADSINRYYISENYNSAFQNHLDVIYPGQSFSKYHSFVVFSPVQSGIYYKTYFSQYRGDIPATFEPVSGDFTIINASPDKFSANITGNFDFYDIVYYDPTQTVELSVSVPVNQKEWILPDLATAFRNSAFNLANFSWYQVTIENMGSLDWSNKYYDIGLNFERLNFYEIYSQGEWISNGSKKRLQGFEQINDIKKKMGIIVLK